MNRKVLIKGFSKQITRKEKIIGLYPKNLDITFPEISQNILIISTDERDNYKSSGAQSILIDGLDENYDEIKEIVKMNGISGIVSEKKFLRINNIVVINCGSKEFNQGYILLHSLDKKYLFHSIGKGDNMSCCGIYSVPKGYNFFMVYFNTTADTKFFDNIIMSAYLKPDNFANLKIIELYWNKYDKNVSYPAHYSHSVGEFTDITFKVKRKGLFNSKFGFYLGFDLIKI